MFTSSILAAVAAAALANAPAPTLTNVSLAKGASYARLVTPLSQPSDPVLDGRIWHCEGQVCRAGALGTAHAQSLARECATVAKKIGAFEVYQTGADALAGDDLAKCNASAKR